MEIEDSQVGVLFKAAEVVEFIKGWVFKVFL